MEHGRNLEERPQDQEVEIVRSSPSVLEELAGLATVPLRCGRTSYRMWFRELHSHLRIVHVEVDVVEGFRCHTPAISAREKTVCREQICLGTHVLQMQIFDGAKTNLQVQCLCESE